jgi:hypothetical protein
LLELLPELPLELFPEPLLELLLEPFADPRPEPVEPDPVDEPPLPWSVELAVVPLVACAAATASRPVAEPAASTRPAVAIRARVMRLWRCAVMPRGSLGQVQPTPKRRSNRRQIRL